MITLFIDAKKIIPNQHVNTVYEIDYDALLKDDIRALLFDLDNTLIPYDIHVPDERHHAFFKRLKTLGFNVFIISNNHKARIKAFCESLDLPFLASAKKPLKSGFKKALKYLDINSEHVVMIGDQLMTDIYGAKRMKLKAILVNPIKRKSEKWYTKINRKLEKKMLKKAKKKYPEDYKRRFMNEVNDG